MISIIPSKPSYALGETVSATVKLDVSVPVAARKFLATLVCVEQTAAADGKTSARTEKLFELTREIAGKGMLGSGNYYVSIKIPENAPPTDYEFGKDNKIRVWTLHVKLDIPLAPDQSAEKEIMVAGIGDV